ncbi:hypothetical protein NC652_020556 [Populus alba x Populus x berolinensis]|nr:hypothetical protein NC652_020556 [Populus alba x Populus x berolinensis]
MGEAATGPFEDACLHSFSEDYEEKSTRICSLLQHDVTNPMWHPFKKEFVDGKFIRKYRQHCRCCVREYAPQNARCVEMNSPLLSTCCDAGVVKYVGEAAYKAVADALMELNDCNPSARYLIPELWSLNDGRKASLQEAIKCVFTEMKTYKSLERKR